MGSRTGIRYVTETQLIIAANLLKPGQWVTTGNKNYKVKREIKSVEWKKAIFFPKVYFTNGGTISVQTLLFYDYHINGESIINMLNSLRKGGNPKLQISICNGVKTVGGDDSA